MSLRDNAAVLSGRKPLPAEDEATALLAAVPIHELPEVDIPEPDENGPEEVPVHTAWLRVRNQIRKIAKGDKYDAPGTRYNFRGIERALNAFGPATLLHGVNVLPVKVEASYRDTRSSADKPTRECTVLVTYRIVGPMGDFFEVQSAGESLDTGDKGTPKALSTALRSLLLLGGLIPTNDPDPELATIERGEAPVRRAQSYLEEILDPSTSRQRLLQINNELKSTRQAHVLVTNEHGQDERIGDMVVRIGKERFAPPSAPQDPGPLCDRCDQAGHHSDACPTLNGGAP